MPEVLKSFTFAHTRKQDWNELLDGQIRKLTLGLDFNGSIENFRHYIYTRAADRGKRVRTTIEGDSIIIQAYESKTTLETKGSKSRKQP